MRGESEEIDERDDRTGLQGSGVCYGHYARRHQPEVAKYLAEPKRGPRPGSGKKDAAKRARVDNDEPAEGRQELVTLKLPKERAEQLLSEELDALRNTARQFASGDAEAPWTLRAAIREYAQLADAIEEVAG